MATTKTTAAKANDKIFVVIRHTPKLLGFYRESEVLGLFEDEAEAYRVAVDLELAPSNKEGRVYEVDYFALHTRKPKARKTAKRAA